MSRKSVTDSIFSEMDAADDGDDDTEAYDPEEPAEPVATAAPSETSRASKQDAGDGVVDTPMPVCPDHARASLCRAVTGCFACTAQGDRRRDACRGGGHREQQQQHGDRRDSGDSGSDRRVEETDAV